MDYLNITVAEDVLASLGFEWTILIILLPLTMSVLKQARQPTKGTAISNGILVALLFILMIAGQALLNNNLLSRYLSDIESGNYAAGSGGVNATHAVLYFLASVFAMVKLFRAMNQLKGMGGVGAVVSDISPLS